MLGTLAGAAAVLSWGAFHPASQLFGPTIRRSRDDTVIALTFDDGPNPVVTPRLLDLLDVHGAKATFFAIGHYVRAYPALLRDIVARGHALGNHTDSHPNLLRASPQRVDDELARCQNAIWCAAGVEAVWMRPPFGFRAPHVHAAAANRGFHPPVMWSRSARDWVPQPPSNLIDRLRRVGGGDVVLLHDGDHRAACAERDATLAALRFWLPRWREQGLALHSLDEMPLDV